MLKETDRLTVKSEIIDGYALKCMCGFGRDGVPDDESTCIEHCKTFGEQMCEQCGIQQAFDRLAAYEDTGLTPEEIISLKAAYEQLVSADDKKERHGHWIFKKRTKLESTGSAGAVEGVCNQAIVLKEHKTRYIPYCSECGEHGDCKEDATNYCPNCGAKMD